MAKKTDENPSVYITPDSDADDVQGHKVKGDSNPGVMVKDSAPGIVRQSDEDDIEGHVLKLDSNPGILRQSDGDDDVEGHKKF